MNNLIAMVYTKRNFEYLYGTPTHKTNYTSSVWCLEKDMFNSIGWKLSIHLDTETRYFTDFTIIEGTCD